MTAIDMSAAGRQRRAAETDARMAASSATGAARAAERRRIEAQVETEEKASGEAQANRAEAAAERDRIGAVVKMGRDRDRGQQALRAALLAPIGPDAFSGLLAAMPRDDRAAPEALAIPGHAAFGSPSAQAERRRISGAFARPEVQGRFAAAASLVLDGDAGLTGEQIAPLLATMPLASPRLLSPGERAQGLAEFGSDIASSVVQSKAEQTSASWKRAVAAANRSIGVTDAAPAPSTLDAYRHPDHPDFGLTEAGRLAAQAARDGA